MNTERLRVAAIQMNTRDDKAANLAAAERLIEAAAGAGAQLVALPEYFNFMGTAEAMREAGEPIPGPTIDRLAGLARRLGIWLHGGSIMEQAPGRELVYNTTVLLNPQGQVAARYRKVHLFDVEAGGAVYRESDTFIPGDEVVVAETPWGGMGLSICYDLRFPELYRSLTARGARIIFTPAAFTLATGKDHWEVLQRARAIENQVFVVAPAQIGEYLPGRARNGNAMIVDPWGTVLARAGEQETYVLAELDFSYQEQVRAKIPCLRHRRPEVYSSTGTGASAAISTRGG